MPKQKKTKDQDFVLIETIYGAKNDSSHQTCYLIENQERKSEDSKNLQLTLVNINLQGENGQNYKSILQAFKVLFILKLKNKLTIFIILVISERVSSGWLS
jgi:hypothetical protein